MSCRKAIAVSSMLAAWSCNTPAPPAAATTDTTAAPETAVATVPASAVIDAALLRGAWSADGENFVWVIDSTTILFEADMQHHPYHLVGDTLMIDRGDPSIGLQKTRIVRLTPDTLVIADVLAGTSEALLRLR